MSYSKQQYETDHPEDFAPSREREMDAHAQNKAAEWEHIWNLIGSEYDMMLTAEGVWTVDGRFFASHEDAHVQRMLSAERKVRERIRRQKQELNQTHVPKELSHG